MSFLKKIQIRILSFLIRNISGDYYDATSKYYVINNIWNNIKLDSIEGDYIEFGIFKGKSLFHSFSTAKKNKIIHNRIFWGLDSFEGFPTENHSFYTSKNFDVSYEKVIKQFSKYENIKIKKGYFSQSLNNKNISEINKIAFAFVDCDIYESSLDVFDFLKKRMTNGGFIMIDDYTSIDNNGNTISKSFLSNFEINKNVYVFGYYSNGVIYRYID
ncbi:MAG: hypothetical protein CBD98_001030 [Flavobacteriaceae bacterium TMED238]|nr:MAG: hypothetical protein CBD98_001030 [Flavobacteriaceae bacterium TMED238]